ncbi:MAG: slipin family protein [Candidatus Thermoplasmatota archaeon]|jgi:regulator of protease activity HflC (stomatin/prohibitin superfamily)|nr:slipin family protein [Candidatus Thermoplasmatota archaeon]MBS3801423.1 slipin family protein [Candidatus Thermoplasmatota archaeon]
MLIPILFVVLLFLMLVLASSIKIMAEYQRIVIFRLGRLQGIKGPGLVFIIPVIDSIIKLDLRTRVIDVPKQRVITEDNVTVDVDAVVYFRVIDAQKAVVEVQRYDIATGLQAQTTLRDVLGRQDLDELLSNREELNKSLQKRIDDATDPWGVKVSAVTIRDVSIPDEMLRAIAKQAEAEREKRSRIIIADGEFQASKKMTDAAKLYEKTPMALRLRELQTLSEISREGNLIIVPGGDMGRVAGIAKAVNTEKK